MFIYGILYHWMKRIQNIIKFHLNNINGFKLTNFSFSVNKNHLFIEYASNSNSLNLCLN